MLESYLNLCHEALDGLCLASLPVIIKKVLPGILLCHRWQHSHRSPPGKMPWINSQIKTTGAVQRAGTCSVLLETATQTLQITRSARGEETPLTHPSSGPQKHHAHDKPPKSRAVKLCRLHLCCNSLRTLPWMRRFDCCCVRSNSKQQWWPKSYLQKDSLLRSYDY